MILAIKLPLGQAGDPTSFFVWLTSNQTVSHLHLRHSENQTHHRECLSESTTSVINENLIEPKCTELWRRIAPVIRLCEMCLRHQIVYITLHYMQQRCKHNIQTVWGRILCPHFWHWNDGGQAVTDRTKLCTDRYWEVLGGLSIDTTFDISLHPTTSPTPHQAREARRSSYKHMEIVIGFGLCLPVGKFVRRIFCLWPTICGLFFW